MSTKNTENNNPDKLPLPEADEDGGDKFLASSEEKVNKLEKQNNQLRFLCILIICVLLSFLLFKDMGTAGVVVIGILELMILLVIGDILGIKIVDVLLTKFLNAFGFGRFLNPFGNKSKPENTEAEEKEKGK